MKKSDIIAACLAGMAIVIATWVTYQNDTWETPPTINAPVPEAPVPEVTDHFNYLVKVTAHNPGGSHVGVGTLVEYDGYTFVLTSKMIFTWGDTHYTVTVNGEQFSAMLLEKDDRKGLAALSLANSDFTGLKVNEAPNIPPDASVLVWNLERSFDVNVIRYLTDPDWLMLDGDLPGTCTGSPITTSDGSLAGVVIGVSTDNASEAFAVGNHAICAFAEEMVNPQLYAPWGLDIFPYNPNDMGNVFREPANPNLLFQGY